MWYAFVWLEGEREYSCMHTVFLIFSRRNHGRLNQILIKAGFYGGGRGYVAGTGMKTVNVFLYIALN